MSDHKRLRVVLRDRAGDPIPDARVMIEASPQPMPDIAALSDDRGMVTLSVPASGRYRLLCVAEGFASTRRDADVGVDAETEAIIIMMPED